MKTATKNENLNFSSILDKFLFFKLQLTSGSRWTCQKYRVHPESKKVIDILMCNTLGKKLFDFLWTVPQLPHKTQTLGNTNSLFAKYVYLSHETLSLFVFPCAIIRLRILCFFNSNLAHHNPAAALFLSQSWFWSLQSGYLLLHLFHTVLGRQISM